MASNNWSQREIEIAVHKYLHMFCLEQMGANYTKAEIHRELASSVLCERSAGSVERRMSNISAVLDSMGYSYLRGYKPLKNVGTNVTSMIESAINQYVLSVAEV